MTTIQVSPKLRRSLAGMKAHPRETYEDVILRLLRAGTAAAPPRADATQRAIAGVKDLAQRLYGDRFDRLIVFGSVARGEATPDSDIDLLLVLRGDVDVGREIDRLAEGKYELDLRHKTLTSIVPISLGDFLARSSPLLMNVRREGIVV